MADSGIGLEVRLGSVDLKIATDKNGKLMYQERAIAGGDVSDERAAVHFSDEFTSWHKGGFIKENVQDGYYYLTCNVDCTYPGRMFPAMRRGTNLSIPAPTHANGYGGIASITSMPWAATGSVNTPVAIVAAYEKKNAGSTSRSDRLRVQEFFPEGAVISDQGFQLETDRFHFNYLRPVWLKEHWYMPALEAGYLRRDAATALAANITSSSAANPTTITTAAAHGMSNGNTVTITGHSLAGVNGSHVIGGVTGTTFTIPVLGGGTGGIVIRTTPAPTPWTLRGNASGDNIPVWAFGSGTDKVYRAYYPSDTDTGPVVTSNILYLSNAALDADLLELESWQNPGDAIPGVLSAHFEQVSIAMLGRNPYVATKSGVFTIGRSGWAESLFPQFQDSPSNSYDFKAYRNYNAMILAGTSNGQIVMFTGGDAVNVGPMVNPAARFTNSNAPTFLDFAIMSSGRIFGTVSDGIQLFIYEGVPRTPGESGPGPIAWHPLLCIPTETTNPPSSANADVLTGDNYSMLRPIAVLNFSLGWPYSAPLTYLWYGAQRADGRIFRWELGDWGDLETGDYNHEDQEAMVGTDNISFRSGRYNRGQKRSIKHWIQLVFDGENITTNNNILVDVAVDGAAFSQVGDLTTNHQSVPIDVRGYDIEVRLRWKPELGSYAAPATIKRIVYEGREQPQQLISISFSVEATTPIFTGAVRQKDYGSTLFNTVDALARGLKQTFRDPFKNDRTVVVLHPTAEDNYFAEGEMPPTPLLQINLLDVP